jgi:hypothetical protein
VAVAIPVQVTVYLCSLSGVVHSSSKPFALVSLIVFWQQNELVFLQYIKKQDTYIQFSGKVCVIN